MKRIFPSFLIGCLLVLSPFAFSVQSKAAELAVPRARVAAVHNCPLTGPCDCGWRHHCRPVCPDGYSCSPLYGAYGPYGGVAYWDAYTGGGWGYRR